MSVRDVHLSGRTIPAPAAAEVATSPRRVWGYLTWQVCVLIYLALPVAIFAATWVRPLVGIPVLVALIASVVFFARREYPLAPRIFGGPVETLIVLALAIVWVGLSGAGGVGGQNADYIKHTKIFRDLVVESWPVIYDAGGKTNILVYYSAWYLPPAAIGKWLGWPAAQNAQYWWTFLGVFLALTFVASIVRGRWYGWVAALIFIFLSGMDVIEQLAFGSLPVGTAHIDVAGGGTFLQFSSNSSALFWVPQQTIYAWLASAFLISCIEKQRVGAIALVAVLGALWSPFCMVGFGALALALAWKTPWRKFFTFENFVGAAAVTLILAPYIGSNRLDFPAMFLWQVVNIFERWPYLAVFYLAEFVVLVWFLGRPRRTDDFLAVWWVAILWLTLCPLYFVGQFSDFTMRSSLPALFVLWIYVLDKLASRPWNAPELKAVYLILAIGAFTPAYEIARSLQPGYSRSIPALGTATIAEWEIGHVKTQYLGSGQSWFARYLLRPGRHAMLHDGTALDQVNEVEMDAWASRTNPNPFVDFAELTPAALDYTEWSWETGSITFFADGNLLSTWGEGTWRITGPKEVTAQFPGKDSTHHLIFDVPAKTFLATTEFTANKIRGVLMKRKKAPPRTPAP